MNITPQTNHRWIIHFAGRGLNHPVRIIVQELCFLKKQQFNGPLNGTNGEWLVILIKKKYRMVHIVDNVPDNVDEC